MSHTSETTAANPDGLITPVTRLVPGHEDEFPVRLLQETLEYATSPQNYLVRRLGKDVFEQRSHLLSIPSELLDRDIYGRGVHKQRFEQHIATTILGKGHGMYFITGIQAQLASMKIWCDRANNHRVSWHYRSHSEIAENNAWAEVFHLQRTFVGKSQHEVPTVADVKLPNWEFGCKTYPYGDLVQISQLCKAANIKLHIDGARLWEIQPFYQGKSLADIARLFDSVYVSFYKGLRGTVGSMLVSSDAEFMDEAQKWQRRLGGSMVTSCPVVIDCERGYNLNIGSFYTKWQNMCSVVSAIMEATREYRTTDGRPIVYFNPEEPKCCQVHTHIQGVTAERLATARDEVERKHRINVFWWAKPWPVLDEMHADWTLVNPAEGRPVAQKGRATHDHHFFEWWISDRNLGIGDDVFAKGWKAFCQLIVAGYY